MYSSISGCMGLRYSSVSKGNPSSGSVNKSHGGSRIVVDSHIGRLWDAGPFFVWGVSLSRAVSMFNRHLFIASRNRATNSARLSHSSSSGRADLKIKPLGCPGVWIVKVSFLYPTLSMSNIEQEKGGTVLWSRVYCMLDIVYLSPLLMMMIAFTTIKSSLVPLIKGLCAQI